MSELPTTTIDTNDTAPGVASAQLYRERMAEMFGVDGQNPSERIAQLKQLSVEGIAIMLEEINKQATGSAESMVEQDKAMTIGDISAVAPEQRYRLFVDLVDAIKQADDSIAPERIADTLALGVVLLHPFKDGNGRTARMLGLTFRENFDTGDYAEDFDLVATSRDSMRQKGGWKINSYIPYIDGDQSDPEVVMSYLASVLDGQKPNLYTSCFGEAPLSQDDSVVEEETGEDGRSFEERYADFAAIIDNLSVEDAEFLGQGMRSKVFKIEKDGAAYAARVISPKLSHNSVESVLRQHADSGRVAKGMAGLEQVVAASETGVVISEFVPGKHMSGMTAEAIDGITYEQLDELIAHRIEASRRGIKFDTFADNTLYDEESGFTDIDFSLGGTELDASDVMRTVFESINLYGQIAVEQDAERKAALEAANQAVFRLIGGYCRSRFSQTFRDELASRFQLTRAQSIASAVELQRMNA